MLETLLAFTAAAALLTLTPGLDTAFIVRTSIADGPRAGALASCGVGLGCLAWGSAVAAGLGLLLAASEFAFSALKWVGAAYLVWLGIQLVLRPRRHFDIGSGEADGGMRAFRRGFLTNILNPKVGVFYVSFLPQFIPDGVAAASWTLLLAALHVVLGLAWSAVLIAGTQPLSRFLRRPGVIAGLDRLTGLLFLGFGLRLVVSER